LVQRTRTVRIVVDSSVARELTLTGEHREFAFTSESTSDDAHVAETEQSRARRGPRGPEADPHVVDEMKTLQGEAKNEKLQS
jgi:hypothetical protein